MTVVFGGTFDPVHIGHLHAASVAADILDTSILMVLSARPAHRKAPVASVEDRWCMLRAACANVERLIPCDVELRRKGPSYAIETLVSLNASHDDPVIWVLGADAFDLVHTWYRFDEFV
ncbi:MAG TPA: nicotinate-nicotinamide nucleotide adenylyltransferase, partial [Gammaproteobacteria bacterium]|nr:nicotinate-nicotinamide nucleotide adenylyltransferase [Gammaproteobacteria bacterium]